MMGYRKFVDEQGTWWQVWEVLPDDAERRLSERRKIHTPPSGDKRDVIDRRKPAPFRTTVPSELADGWLVFQSLTRKRRYWPIPLGWQDFPVSELRVLCRAAHEVLSRFPDRFDTGEMGGAAPPVV